MRGALVADTSGLLRALAASPEGGPAWPAFADALQLASVVIVPSLVLAEVDYFLRKRRAAMTTLLDELFDPATTYEYEPATPADLRRAQQFDQRFADLELGLVDGLVAAVAERRSVRRILTTDHRDLGVVRIGPRFNKPLVLVPT